MSKETAFRYYEPAHTAAASTESSTMPSRSSAALTRRPPAVHDAGSGHHGVSAVSGASAAGVHIAVKVAAGAGDKCVAPARSKPKRRLTIRADGDDDTLDVHSVEWTSGQGFNVSQLVAEYQSNCPLLAKVTEDHADFIRGQVGLYVYCH